jgi:hypothetical protein
LDEMDIQEALTLALRVRRHQFDANTGNLRSSPQITAQIDPRSASPSQMEDRIRCASCPYLPHDVYPYSMPHERSEAFLQLRVAVHVLRVAVRVLASAWHSYT